MRAELLEIGVVHSITPGPLILKSTGKTKKGVGADSIFIPMPLLTGSTYAFLHRTIDLAHSRLVERGAMGFALGGDREAPHFAHNTWRRMAATAAQACLDRGECSAEDVDLQLGWKLKKYAKLMRLHYASRGARAIRARITEQV